MMLLGDARKMTKENRQGDGPLTRSQEPSRIYSSLELNRQVVQKEKQ
jgi:hypothetical protein